MRLPLHLRHCLLSLLCPLALAPTVRSQRDVEIPMRDGKSLAATFWLPEADGPWPAILIQTPYNRRLMAAVTRGARGAMGAALDREHYAIVVVDWRGFFGSRDAAQGIRRPNRGNDGYDCVEWVAAQDWCTGKVGTYGGSALGHQQFATAAKQPPHLVCAVPLIAATNHGYTSFYRGGVLLESHVQSLTRLGFGPLAAVRRFPHSGAVAWRVAENVIRPRDIQVPVLLITGWWDLFPQEILDSFASLRAEGGDATRAHSHLLIGPWDHVSIDRARQGDLEFAAAAGEAARWTRQFFDQWLRGIQPEQPLPRLRWFACGEDAWIDGDTLPGVATRDATWFLAGDDLLQPAPPQTATSAQWTHDPARPAPTLGGANLPPLPVGPKDHGELATRDDVATFTTAKLTDWLRITGSVRAELTATIDGDDADFAVWLCDVDPSGRATLIQDGIHRASLRESTARPTDVTPGEPLSLTVTLPPIAYTLLPGHVLRLHVGSANWPRFERNPPRAAAGADPARPLRVTLHLGPDGSRLVLPVR